MTGRRTVGASVNLPSIPITADDREQLILAVARGIEQALLRMREFGAVPDGVIEINLRDSPYYEGIDPRTGEKHGSIGDRPPQWDGAELYDWTRYENHAADIKLGCLPSATPGVKP